MILVAGGTGFLGSHIVRSLAEHGHHVRVLTRDPDGIADFGQKETAAGDVRDPSTLGEAIAGCRAVVMAAQFHGHPMEKPRRGRSYDAVDRAGTENLLAAGRAAGVERFLYLSGAGVGQGRSEPWFVAKDRAEAAVRASGLAWINLRPSWAYGLGDRALNRIATIARFSPVVPVLGWNRQRVMPVWAGDVGETAARAFATDGAWNRTIEIGGPEILSMREVIQTLMRVSGHRRVLIPMPTWLAKVATAPLAVLPNPPLTPRGVAFATADALVDNAAARDFLAMEPIPLEDGLTRYPVGRSR